MPNYQILKVTDEHGVQFICGTSPICQERDTALLSKCEIYRYSEDGRKILGLAFPNGKEDGFHNRVQVLDSGLSINDANDANYQKYCSMIMGYSYTTTLPEEDKSPGCPWCNKPMTIESRAPYIVHCYNPDCPNYTTPP